MEENINVESVETQEVAEPEVEDVESVETQEVAEPDKSEETAEEAEERSGKTSQDTAFAEQRRRIKELEEQNAKLTKDYGNVHAALSRFFEGETADELSINANAYAEQREPDEYRKEWERNQEYERLKADNEALQNQLIDFQVEQLMQKGLREVQEVDPSVKSLEDLGEHFLNFIKAGLPSKEAYYATKAMEVKEAVLAPDAIGKVTDTKTERDYYTSQELDNLTDEEMEANWDKVMKSMQRLK